MRSKLKNSQLSHQENFIEGIFSLTLFIITSLNVIYFFIDFFERLEREYYAIFIYFDIYIIQYLVLTFQYSVNLVLAVFS